MKKMLSELITPTKSDLSVISHQLGAKNGEPYAVAERCRHGFPSIVVFSPFSHDGTLNHGFLSTPVWLSCPYLNEKIHHFETGGYIHSITDLLISDQEIFSMMKEAHAHYYFLRKELFRMCSGESPSNEYIRFMDKGIGGMVNVESLKCLHLHYSHYKFCSYNVAGMIASKLIGEDIFCQNRRCVCF